ncbi:MAG: hypothetical protein IKN85_09200 [Oscillospiraceae bacterium]|nr:hypothetical protein [Oscillospiraceae bacterium]
MGVFIRLELSDTITQKEWSSVYEKSLVMAKIFGFFDFSVEEISNQSVKCIIPTDENTFDERTGWMVSGSFPSYKSAEAQFTPKIFGVDSYDGEKYDILRFYEDDKPHEVSEGHRMKSIWCNKTQGEPYHMGLLAIGCMAEQMLGVQATVRGDITYGQCINAAQIASEALGEEIKPPVTCRLEDLYERIERFDDFDECKKLSLLKRLYLGTNYNEFGEFQKKHFSEECIRKYWREKLKGTGINTFAFSHDLREYFRESADLKRFCEIADFNHKDPEQCTKVIQGILKSSMYVKDKDCTDHLDLNQRSDPYGIPSMFASFFLGPYLSAGPDRFIPLEEMRKVFSECFGDVINVNEVVDDFLENRDDAREKGRETLNNRIESVGKEMQKYDINTYEDLVYFEPGNTFRPSLLKVLKDSFKTYKKCNDHEEFAELMKYKPSEKFKFLAENTDGYILTLDQWSVIYDELERDKESLRRYFPMVCVTTTGNFSFLIRELVTNNEFWNYCCENFTVDDESEDIPETT